MSNEEYRKQLDRLVADMTVANHEQAIASDIDRGDAERVKMFVDGNLDKRLDKLESAVEFIADEFDDMESLLMDYIRQTSSPAYDTINADCERFFAWLCNTQPLSIVQGDLIACQSARNQIEVVAELHREKYLAFQKLLQNNEDLLPQLEFTTEIMLHLNPIRVWSEFHTTALIDDAAELPARVLFFPAAGEIATAVLELEGQALVNELSDYAPCTLTQWATFSNVADSSDLRDTCIDLAQMGLIALEE